MQQSPGRSSVTAGVGGGPCSQSDKNTQNTGEPFVPIIFPVTIYCGGLKWSCCGLAVSGGRLAAEGEHFVFATAELQQTDRKVKRAL